ncbi:MAG: AI-2E family transporter [Bacteroidales bacterium]|nr:AI-2E family transporter [Bacteroidales bacterium]MCB9013572.1 AI-2E family transporter [Bacteroidales bacterium]
MNKTYPLYVKVTIVMLMVILFFFAIIQAKDFLYPIVLGVLFGYLVYPIANYFEKKGLPRIPASLIGIAFFVFIISVVLVLIYNQTGNLLDNFPVYKQKALANIDALETMVEKQFGIADLRITEFLRSRVKFFFEAGSDKMNKVFSNIAGTLFRLGILPVYMFLFLYYRTKLAYFILKMVAKENRPVAVDVLNRFSSVVPRYMGGVSTVVLIIMIINTAGLSFFGAEHPLVFGIVSGLFAFIPYFGVLIGGVLPVGFTLLTGDSSLTALQLAIFYPIVNTIENNILTPNIVGSSLRLNPMMIILGIIGAGMVWGLPGMFSIVPLLAMFNIMTESVPKLHPYSFLLGETGTRRHSITIENIRLSFRRFKKEIRKRFKK